MRPFPANPPPDDGDDGPCGPAWSALAMSAERLPEHVRTLRTTVRVWLHRVCLMPEDRADAVLLLISELAGNTVRHGTGPTLACRAWSTGAGLLRIEIDDPTRERVPRARTAPLLAESGRGLFLVNAFVRELGGAWGHYDGGVTAWCEFPLTAGPSAA
ncbi:ATP-binding protein [Streptomyces sp. NPDC001941]|uniref:ATP-binding protein n=1 Tax=Streptomyces sp. NPDC001941 TaxID=3154659 RepID=UPI003317EC9A